MIVIIISKKGKNVLVFVFHRNKPYHRIILKKSLFDQIACTEMVFYSTSMSPVVSFSELCNRNIIRCKIIVYACQKGVATNLEKGYPSGV